MPLDDVRLALRQFVPFNPAVVQDQMGPPRLQSPRWDREPPRLPYGFDHYRPDIESTRSLVDRSAIALRKLIGCRLTLGRPPVTTPIRSRATSARILPYDFDMNHAD